MIEKQRYEVLDGLRGLAAVIVMLFHFTEPNGFDSTLFPSASLAVDLFFCLSGFVIAHAYQKQILGDGGLWGFFRRRIIRLYPAFVVGACLGVVALCIHHNRGGVEGLSEQSLIAAAMLNIFYVPYFGEHIIKVGQSWTRQPVFPINPAAWSLFFEFVVNALFYYALRLKAVWFGYWPTAAFFALILSTLAYDSVPGWSATNFLGGLPRAGYTFFVGAFLYFNFSNFRLKRSVPASVPMAALFILCYITLSEKYNLTSFASRAVVIPFIVLIGASCSFVPNGSFRKIALYFGALSYPIYCIHFPIHLLFGADQAIGPYWLLVIKVLTTLILAHIVLRLEPLLGRLLNKWLPV